MESMAVSDLIGVLAVLVLVAANRFFVASTVSLVAVHRSRMAELVAVGRHRLMRMARCVRPPVSAMVRGAVA